LFLQFGKMNSANLQKLQYFQIHDAERQRYEVPSFLDSSEEIEPIQHFNSVKDNKFSYQIKLAQESFGFQILRRDGGVM